MSGGKSQSGRLQEGNLPVEVICQIPVNLLMRMGHFSAPAALVIIVRRSKIVLISIRIGSGRVPSAGPMQCDGEQDLYR